MKLRKFMCVATAAVLTTSVLFTGCSSKNGDNNGTGGNNGQTNDKVNEDIFEDDGVFSKFDQNYTWNSDATVITLGNEDVEITKGGEYIISGTLSDGRIYINVTDDEKVQLILVMSRKAALYLLDEPIGGVDPATRDYILNSIIRNYSENSTVLISTHLIADVEGVLDEIIFIKEGKLVLHDSVDSVREQEGKSIDQLFREVFRW